MKNTRTHTRTLLCVNTSRAVWAFGAGGVFPKNTAASQLVHAPNSNSQPDTCIRCFVASKILDVYTRWYLYLLLLFAAACFDPRPPREFHHGTKSAANAQ